MPVEKKAIEYGWQVTFELLSQLQHEVVADGAEFAIVLIPPGDVIKMELMNAAEQEEVFRKFPFLQDGQTDLPNQRIIEKLSNQNINILDLQPLLIEQQAKEAEVPLYLPIDKHWTVAGNRFTAETIYNWLNEVVWRDRFVHQ